MAGRRVPGDRERAAEARFNQLQVSRFVNPIAAALNHSTSRNSRVVQAVCFFSVIRNSTPSLSSARVLVSKAERQLFRSPGGYQAAHYLPGQIRINDHVPWSLISNRVARNQLESLFGEVENLPAAFNVADSAAEDKGLREAFRAASEEIFRHSTQRDKGTVVSRELVRTVYDQVWVPKAQKAFIDAIAQKQRDNPLPAIALDEQGSIANLEARESASWSRQEEIDILYRYHEAMRTPPRDLLDEKMAGIEQAFRS